MKNQMQIEKEFRARITWEQWTEVFDWLIINGIEIEEFYLET